MKNSEIAEIVRKVWENKEAHAGELVDAIWKTIYFITFKKINNKQEAEDLTQEITLYIYNHIEELKSAEAFYTWMNTIIYGFCNRRIYQLGRRNSIFSDIEGLDEKEDDAEGPEELVLTQEQQQSLVKIIDGLSQKQKDVVFLFYYQQIPLAHISEILGCSLNAVKNRLHTARQIMKDQMKRQKDGSEFKLLNFSLGSVLLYAFGQEEALICDSSIRERIEVNEKIKTKNRKVNSKKVWAAVIAVGILFFAGILGTAVFLNRNTPQPDETPSNQALNSDESILGSEEEPVESDASPGEPPVQKDADSEESVRSAADEEQPENRVQPPAAQLIPEPEGSLLPVKGRLHIHNYITQGEAAEQLSGAIFRIYKLNDSGAAVTVQKASQVDLATMLDSTFESVDLVTNTNGIASITLNRGIYYVVQQEDQLGREALLAEPFLVSVPMKDLTAETGWLEDVHVYPKNEYLSISKTVGEECLLHGTYNLLDSFSWTIDAVVPSGLYVAYPENATSEQMLETDGKNRNIIKFGIVDKLGTKFKYVDAQTDGDTNIPLPLTVYQLDEEGKNKGVIPSDYYNFKIDEKNTLSVYFNPEGRKYLKEHNIGSIRVVFYTKLTVTSEDMNKPIYNDLVKLEFTDQNRRNTCVNVINPPEVHTGKIKIIKVDADDQDIKLAGAGFKVASSRKNAEQGIFLKKLVDGTTVGALEDILVTTGADGTAVIEGLAYGSQGDNYNQDSAGTKYYLVEVSAPRGYNKLKEIVEVSVEEGTAEYISQVAVKNGKGIILTETSDKMDILSTISGIIISGLAIIYSILSDKKKKI